VPEVEPHDYFGVEVTQRAAAVSDEQVDHALEAKQREHTEYLPIEGRETAQGDVMLVDVMGKIGDQPISRERELVELEETPREPLPGLAAKLTGIAAEPGDIEVELEVPLHSHGPDEPCPGDERTETARLLVTVRDVKQKVVPELDDEFAKDTGEGESLEELRQKLRQELLEADEKRAQGEAKDALVAKLLEINDVPLVPALVERHLEQLAQFQMMLMGGQGDPGAVKEQLRPDAEKTVRSTLLIQAIAEKEKVQADEADVEKRLAEMATSREENVAKIRSEYEKEDRMEGLRRVIREEKTLDMLLSRSNIVEEEPSSAADEASAADAADDAGDS
jgi:trigger factor